MKGAFTGADTDRPGLVERARGGTLFLDEVGELPASAQVKLLRVLAERSVRRVGASEATPVDFRLVCATLRDLSELVAAKTFREDLLYRLQVLSVDLPPLRKRIADLPLLVDYLVDDLATQMSSTIRGVEPAFLARLEKIFLAR